MIQLKEVPDVVFKSTVRKCDTFMEAARQLGLPYNYVLMRAHMLKVAPINPRKKKRLGTSITKEQIIEQYLSNNKAIDSSALRKLLLKTGLKEAKCEP